MVVRLLFAHRRVVAGNRRAGQPEVFDGPDHPLYIVGVNGRGRLRIHLGQHGVKHLGRALPLTAGQIIELPPHRAVLGILLKLHAVEQGLNVKPGAAGDDGKVSPGIDALHGLQGHFLKGRHIEFLPGIQHVDQVVGDTLHLLSRNLGGSDVHMAVHLHGIRADNLPVQGLCQADGQGGFSHSSGACQNDKGLFHGSSITRLLFQTAAVTQCA